MFNRYQVCLGYYWFMAYGYADYTEACDINRRLLNIGYKPSFADEHSDSMKKEENELALYVFNSLMKNGYRCLNIEENF